MTPEPDLLPDLDDDEDLSTPPPLPDKVDVDATIREAVAWVETELVGLREQRKERDRTGLAEIDRLKKKLIRDRQRINAEIAALVAEQERLARLVRVLDRK